MEVKVKKKSMREIKAGLPPIVREELDLFDSQIQDYLSGLHADLALTVTVEYAYHGRG